jgi:hypothetical protein
MLPYVFVGVGAILIVALVLVARASGKSSGRRIRRIKRRSGGEEGGGPEAVAGHGASSPGSQPSDASDAATPSQGDASETE